MAVQIETLNELLLEADGQVNYLNDLVMWAEDDVIRDARTDVDKTKALIQDAVANIVGELNASA